jgi:hypothetical protein
VAFFEVAEYGDQVSGGEGVWSASICEYGVQPMAGRYAMRALEEKAAMQRRVAKTMESGVSKRLLDQSLMAGVGFQEDRSNLQRPRVPLA